MRARLETASAIVLLALLWLACVWLAIAHVRIRSELDEVRSVLEQQRNSAAIATLNDIALPANAPLRLCNHGHDRAEVTALAGIYSEPAGNFNIFNSAHEQWRTWDAPAGAQVPLDMRDKGWNGQALFYAIDVTAAGKRRLLAGTSRDLQSGCVNFLNQTEGGDEAHNR